jgi:glycerate kinase
VSAVTRRIVIAMDSFKGSIGATDAVSAVRHGWLSVRPHDDVRMLPMADGGEGTVDAFAASVPAAVRQPVTVLGPDDQLVHATWLLLPAEPQAPHGTAVVELASTSGIELLGSPPALRPFDAHTVGFGQAIADALGHGVSHLVLGIGSSSSTDGGIGLLSALGARIVTADGQPVARGGRGLADIAAVDLSGLPPLPPLGVTVLTDVVNPLVGPRGAAAVFGPQKGARPDDVTLLDRGLTHFASLMPADPGMPGTGAAGGAGFALLAWGAVLTPGAGAVAELAGLAEALRSADAVITGEGSFDGQSAEGKAPAHVAALAAAARVPVSLVAGRIAPDADTAAFTSSASLTELAGSSSAAMAEPRRWLVAAGVELAAGFVSA